MSGADQKQFTDAMAKAKADQVFLVAPTMKIGPWHFKLVTGWRCSTCCPLSSRWIARRDSVANRHEAQKNVIGERGAKRIWFARSVVWGREIEDQGLPDDEVNDGREFLGWTQSRDWYGCGSLPARTMLRRNITWRLYFGGEIRKQEFPGNQRRRDLVSQGCPATGFDLPNQPARDAPGGLDIEAGSELESSRAPTKPAEQVIAARAENSRPFSLLEVERGLHGGITCKRLATLV